MLLQIQCSFFLYVCMQMGSAISMWNYECIRAIDVFSELLEYRMYGSAKQGGQMSMLKLAQFFVKTNTL
jgi:hypothetical protein